MRAMAGLRLKNLPSGEALKIPSTAFSNNDL